MTSQDIIIDLDAHTSDADRVEESHLFQQEALKRAKALMKTFLADAKNDAADAADASPRHVHNTITINGSRGSGKTMFILNLLGSLPTDKDLSSLRPLDILDPTLIENKENMVLTVLARIYAACKLDHGTARCLGDDGDRDKDFRKVDEALKNLSKGLCLLDGVGKDSYYGDDWSETDHIARKGMDQASQGALLEQNIHSFIRAALVYLKKDAFVLAFDDIDTQFERGWPVLEAIRKYFTTPRLIVLLSGDMGLYSKLVRRTQFENLGDTLLKNDRPSRDFHANTAPWDNDRLVQMVDRLEEQYLMKVLKPENRLTLHTLNQIGRSKQYSLKVRYKERNKENAPEGLKDQTKEECIDAALGQIVQRGFEAMTEKDLYNQVLLDQPARTVMQFLVASRELLKSDETPARDTSAFAERLTDVFTSALYHSGLDPQTINRATPHGLLDQVITWFNVAGTWDTGYRLKPEYADSDRNQVALVLGARFTHETNQSLGEVLNYMLKVAWTHEHVVESDPKVVTSDAIVNYLGLRQTEKASTISRRSVAVTRSFFPAKEELLRGTLPVSNAKFTDAASAIRALYIHMPKQKPTKEEMDTLKGKFPKECEGDTNDLKHNPGIVSWWGKIQPLHKSHTDYRKNKAYKLYVYNTINSLSEVCDKNTNFLRMAVLSISTGGREKSYISLMTLLGSLADLLTISSNDEQWQTLLTRLAQVRTYPGPEWQQASAEKTQETEDEDEDLLENQPGEIDKEDNASSDKDDQEPDDAALLEPHVRTWAKQAAAFTDIRYSIAFYGRIFTRFYYALGNMDGEFSGRDTYVGTVMHRQIVAFLHAVLVEEMLETNTPRYIKGRRKSDGPLATGPRLENAILSDGPFWDNLPFAQIIKDGKVTALDYKTVDLTHLPLFRLFFSCPVFALFINPQSRRIPGKETDSPVLFDLMIQSWHSEPAATAAPAETNQPGVDPEVAAKPEPDAAPDDTSILKARKAALEVECLFRAETKTASKLSESFPNLWAPLHSVMVPGKRQVPATIKIPAPGKAPGAAKPRRGRPPANATAPAPAESPSPIADESTMAE